MKILTLSYEFPPLGGGGSQVVRGLAAEFVSQGHEVDVITMAYKDLARSETVDGARIRRVPCLRKSVDLCQPWEQATYLARALPAALELGAQKSYDIIHCHFILPDGLAGIQAGHKLDLPLAVTAHGSDVPGYNPDRFKLLHRLIGPVWRSSVRKIDRIICPSAYLQGLILQHEPEARTMTIPNGLAPEKFDAARARKPQILAVTRMLERKGIQDVLRALDGTDFGFGLHVVGTGPYLSELKKLANELDVDVTFHGWLDNNSLELKELFETSSIFVFPSHAENFPLVLLESMAAGLAIVTTDDTGCREVVGDAAIRVPPRNPAAIREAIGRLAADSGECRRLGGLARKRLDEQFSWKAVSHEYLEAFRLIIEERH